MTSMLNDSRPPVFCPGCSHDQVVRALDQALQELGLKQEQVAIVSDIGCSGLFDTFFNTHAFHGLHGRALTYATGIKMARPDLHVIVTMGDGGLGIGGAHVLSTCRRNIDLTLLVMNNFNYGMTGGQCSATTPPDAQVSSGFLNRLEKPIDICYVAGAAGAGHVARVSTYQKDLVEQIKEGIEFDGFSLLDIRGVCTGRFTKRNKINPAMIDEQITTLPPVDHFADMNRRLEYGKHYRDEASCQKLIDSPLKIEKQYQPLLSGRQEVVFLGSAGKRIVTAGELLCLAGITAGLNATQKNDYPITVLRGHSVSEVILSQDEIGYTGISTPSVVIALAPEGVARRKKMLQNLPENALVLAVKGLELPEGPKNVVELDFKELKIKSTDWALAALAWLAKRNQVISMDMLKSALATRFKSAVLESATAMIDQVPGPQA